MHPLILISNPEGPKLNISQCKLTRLFKIFLIYFFSFMIILFVSNSRVEESYFHNHFNDNITTISVSVIY